MARELSVGTRIKLSDSIGLGSGKTGVIVRPSDIPKRGDGVPLIPGYYKPVDYKKEYAIKLDDGQYTTMFKGSVYPERPDLYAAALRARVQPPKPRAKRKPRLSR